MTQPTSRVNRLSADFFALDKLGLGLLLFSYATLLGAAYVFGYWRVFGLDVFPFMSSLDYVSAPLNRLLVLIATPLLFAVIVLSAAPVEEGNRHPYMALYIVVLYSVGFITQYYEAFDRFRSATFYFDNEKTVLLIAALLFLGAMWFSFVCYRDKMKASAHIVPLLIFQMSLSLIAGYSDGKAIFNGAGNVMFLDNKELCEKNGVRDWVLAGKFSEQTIFMNTIDKRLCITKEKSFLLVSRKYKEGL